MSRLARGLLLLLLLASPATARVTSPDFAPAGTATLGSVIDGETVKLADGRTLRLVGIETVPKGALVKRAMVELDRLIAGKPLELRLAGTGTDREGRVEAELFAGGKWVQRELVRRGLARVHGTADNRLGLTALLATEESARKAKRGVWRLADYAVRDAADAARDAGSWQIVEGTVASVASSEDGTHIDFGADWRTSFSIHIARDDVATFRAAGFDFKSLVGARLRVRGFIDGTRRPTIEANFPEQIEVLAR